MQKITNWYWRNYIYLNICIFLFFVTFAIYFDSNYLFFFPFLLIVSLSNKWSLKTLFYTLIFSICFSIEFNVTDSLATDLPTEPLLLLLTLLTPIILIENENYKKINWNHSLILIIFLQILWAVASTIISDRIVLGFKYTLAKIWFIIPTVILSQIIITSKKDIIYIFLLLVIPMLLIALRVNIGHAFTSFTFESINHHTGPFFRNHVNYSGILAITGPILLFLRNYFKANKKLLIGFNIALSFFIIAIYFSYARGAWLAILVTITCIYLLKKKLFTYSYIFGSIIILVAALYLSNNNKYLDYKPNYNKTIFHSNWSDHINATLEGKDVSVVERYYRWIAAINMGKENLLFGVGPNQYYPNYKQYTITSFRTWVSDNKDKSSIHQYFLLLFCEQGIVGMTLFWLLSLSIFYTCEKKYHLLKDTFTKSLLLVIASVSVIIFVLTQLSDLIETDKFGILWFLMIGLLLNKNLFSLKSNIENTNEK